MSGGLRQYNQKQGTLRPPPKMIVAFKNSGHCEPEKINTKQYKYLLDWLIDQMTEKPTDQLNDWLKEEIGVTQQPSVSLKVEIEIMMPNPTSEQPSGPSDNLQQTAIIHGYLCYAPTMAALQAYGRRCISQLPELGRAHQLKR